MLSFFQIQLWCILVLYIFSAAAPLSGRRRAFSRSPRAVALALSVWRRCAAGPAGTRLWVPGAGAQDGGGRCCCCCCGGWGRVVGQWAGAGARVPAETHSEGLHVRSDPEQGNITRVCVFSVDLQREKALQTERPVRDPRHFLHVQTLRYRPTQTPVAETSACECNGTARHCDERTLHARACVRSFVRSNALQHCNRLFGICEFENETL